MSVEFTHGICNQIFSASGTHEDLYHLISNAPGLAALLKLSLQGTEKCTNFGVNRIKSSLPKL